MSIHLVGGGRAEEHEAVVYGPFLREAVARAHLRGAECAEVAVVVVRGPDEQSEMLSRFSALLERLGPVACRGLEVVEGSVLPAEALGEPDGLLVAGGLTPAYLDALAPRAEELRSLVSAGLPYLGFSAGAVVACRRALVGGYRQHGVVVCAEDNAEDLDELTVRDGLGLVDLTIDVHAAQWGNVSRLLAAVHGGEVDHGVAIDEDTVLILGPEQRVAGAGRLWWVRREQQQVAIRLAGAGL